ncbi:MAG: RNA-binding protein [Gammaproteobacteria bacterium]|nr:RNA-binding protein [Gammaproteobacteria bacterium]
MQVIFCHIPARATVEELLHFAESGARSLLHRIRGKPVVLACEILEVLDKADGSCEFHGLVTYASPALGEKAIARLKTKKFFGLPVNVRPYNHRSPGDRRVVPRKQGLNRPDERRRSNQVIVRRGL